MWGMSFERRVLSAARSIRTHFACRMLLQSR